MLDNQSLNQIFIEVLVQFVVECRLSLGHGRLSQHLDPEPANQGQFRGETWSDSHLAISHRIKMLRRWKAAIKCGKTCGDGWTRRLDSIAPLLCFDPIC
jgi:hypothetical protein